MTSSQNRQRWLIGGGAGCLILISLCIVGLWLYFIGRDQFFSPVARPPAPTSPLRRDFRRKCQPPPTALSIQA